MACTNINFETLGKNTLILWLFVFSVIIVGMVSTASASTVLTCYPTASQISTLGNSSSTVDIYNYTVLRNSPGNLNTSSGNNASSVALASTGAWTATIGLAMVTDLSTCAGNNSFIPESIIISYYGGNVKLDPRPDGKMVVGIDTFTPNATNVIGKEEWNTRGHSLISDTKTMNVTWLRDGRNNFTLSTLSAVSNTTRSGLLLTTTMDISGSYNGTPLTSQNSKVDIWFPAKGDPYKPFYQVIGHYATTPTGSTPTYYNFTMIGDSITEGLYTTHDGINGYGGWVLESQPAWNISNQGISGQDMVNITNHYSQQVAFRPTNTTMLEEGNSISHGYSLSENIAQILGLEAMAVANGTTLYLNTVPPRGYGPYAYTAEQNVTRAQLNQWIVCNFTPNHGNRYFFDLNASITDPANASQIKSDYTYDGTHLSEAGYERWGTSINTAFPSIDTTAYCLQSNVTPTPTPTPMVTPAPAITCENQTGNISIYLSSSTMSTLKWSWGVNETLTSISLDGITISDYEIDNTTPWYTGTEFEPATWHSLRIKNATNYGRLNCITNSTPVTPYAPVMNPSVENKSPVDKIASFWWIPVFLATAWFLRR